MNFGDFYNQKDGIDENFLTALAGKIGTAAMNIFRKTSKHISIAPEFLRVFKQIDIKKYNKTLDKLSNDFDKQIKYKNIFIKDIRIGDIAGGKGNIVDVINKYVPKVADKDNEIWQNKEHAPAVTVYMLSNGGNISLWNLPTDQNKPDEGFNPSKRIYAIGMNGAAEKAFMLIFGMGFKDWLVKQYVEEEPAKKEAKAEEAKEKLSIKTINITPEKYKSLVPITAESVSFKTFFIEETQEEKIKAEYERQEKEKKERQAKSQPTNSLINKIKELGAGDPKEIPPESQENMKKGYVYDFGKKGKLYVYINKNDEHKMAYSKSLEPLLIKYNIITKQDEIKLENVKLRSF